MLIRYKDFVIRDATQADCLTLLKWWNDPVIMEFAGLNKGMNMTFDEVINSLVIDKTKKRTRLVIEKSNTLIGEMSYSDIGNDTAKIGINICLKEQQNKGYGKIILSLVISELKNIGFLFVTLDTNINNLRAQNVYKKLGFQQTKIVESAYTNQLGQSQSSIHYILPTNELINFAI